MTSKKTLRSYFLLQNTPKAKTRPERNFNAYQESRGMGLVWDKELPFIDPGDNSRWKLQCDFLRPTGFEPPRFLKWDVDFEVDGSKFHETRVVDGVVVSAGKDAWRDRLKVASGLKVVHVPAAVTIKDYWDYLDQEVPRALKNPLRSVHIDG